MKIHHVIFVPCALCALVAFSMGTLQAQVTVTNKGQQIIIPSGAVLSVKGNFTNASDGTTDGTIDCDGTMNVTGNWTNNAANGGRVFVTSTGTVKCIGTSQQTIGGQTTRFPGLEINNSAGINLDTDGQVTGTLTMTAGNIASSSTLTLGSSAVAPGALAWTAGYMTGTMAFVRWFGTATLSIGDVAGLFPMGAGSANRSVWLGSSAMTSGGTASVRHTTATGVSVLTPFSDGGINVDLRHNLNWTISADNGLNGTFNLRLQAGGISGVHSYADLRLIGVSGAAGGASSNGTGSNSDPQINRTGLTTLQLGSTFYVGSNAAVNPLPVELAGFTARYGDGRVDLHWKTATESNNEGFAVERRTATDGGWREIGFVRGAGSSNTPISYSFTDLAIPASGELRYRLKQIDRDGAFEYSTTAVVKPGGIGAFEVYPSHPNPFSSATTIAFTLPRGGVTSVRLFDVTGRLVRTIADESMSAGFNSVTLNAAGLVPGSYRYVVSSGGATKAGVVHVVK